MDIEPDRQSGRRTTATVIGRVRAKFMIAAFMMVETALVWSSFHDRLIAGFLTIGALWFLLDATVLWKERAYSRKQMRLFLLGWNAASLLGMVWNWTQASLTHLHS
jgi:4-hydroxybenzoate polyprenyltransferase